MDTYILNPQLRLLKTLILLSHRLTFADPPPSRSTSLLKMGSKFRYSDRTLYQLHKDGHPIKDQPKFNRVSSLNWSRRYQMPSLSETRIYVDEKDDAHKKRPLSEGDMPSKMPVYIRKGVQACATLYCMYIDECFTGKYSIHKVYANLHPGLNVGILLILTS